MQTILGGPGVGKTGDESVGVALRNSGFPARLRLWEMDSSLKCPIIGMCLSLPEQRQLLKKAGIALKSDSAFELHETLVSRSGDENTLSRRVDRFLHQKYGRKGVEPGSLGAKEIMAHWKAAFREGRFPGALWAAACNPGLSRGQRREIHGDIHMAMHLSAQQADEMRRDMAELRRRVEDLQGRMVEGAEARRALQDENARLTRWQREREKDTTAAREEKARLEEELSARLNSTGVGILESENERLRKELAEVRADLARTRRDSGLLETRTRELEQTLDRQREADAQFRRDATQIIEEFRAMKSCDSACPSFDLCRKRILIVGGIARMESLYRTLIEGSGGIFEYHDGYVKNGIRQLENSFKRADMVLCPVNCNSHAACSIVKNLGKKHNKPVHMLGNFSLSAVSRIIQGGAEERAEQ